MPEGQPNVGTESKGARNCLIGCGVALVVGLVLVIGGGYYAFIKVRALAADGMHDEIQKMVNKSELPEADKTAIMKEVAQLRDDIKGGEMSLTEIGFLAREFAEGPLLPLLMAKGAEEAYVKSSGLSDEEKADAVLQLERFTTGVFNDKIPQSDAEKVLDLVTVEDPETGQTTLKESLTDEELRAFIEAMRAESDEAGVSDDPPAVDIAAEIRQTVDRAKQRARNNGKLDSETGADAGTGANTSQGQDGEDGEDGSGEGEAGQDGADGADAPPQ